MTANQINHVLIDHKKSKRQLAAEMRELGIKVADTQVYDVLAENGERGDNIIAKVLEGAEKVIRRWEDESKNKKLG